MKIDQNLWDSLETIRTQGTIDRKLERAADVANVTPERRGWLIRAFAGMYRAAQGNRSITTLDEDYQSSGANLRWLRYKLADTYSIYASLKGGEADLYYTSWGGVEIMETGTPHSLTITINPQDSTEHDNN